MYLGERGQPKLVFIDEAWDLLTQGDVAKFIEAGYRRFRKYFGAAITVTQSLNDLYTNPTGRAIADNSAHTLLLAQPSQAIDQLRAENRLPLSEAGAELPPTLRADRGSGSAGGCWPAVSAWARWRAATWVPGSRCARSPPIWQPVRRSSSSTPATCYRDSPPIRSGRSSPGSGRSPADWPTAACWYSTAKRWSRPRPGSLSVLDRKRPIRRYAPVYLLTPDVRARFALERVPATVEAQGRVFLVREVPPERGSEVR